MTSLFSLWSPSLDQRLSSGCVRSGPAERCAPRRRRGRGTVEIAIDTTYTEVYAYAYMYIYMRMRPRVHPDSSGVNPRDRSSRTFFAIACAQAAACLGLLLCMGWIGLFEHYRLSSPSVGKSIDESKLARSIDARAYALEL